MEVPPWLEALPLAPEYYPTEEEFSDPIGYILKIEQEALHFGICKIVPPYPKAPKRVVINNLNSSLAVSRDAPPSNASGSSASLPRSMGPARSMGGVPGTNSHLEAEAGGKARFTTRRQQLGWGVQKTRVPLPQAVTHKLVWQSGECYTLDQFEAKAKTFSRNRLGTAREVAPFTVETLFWRAACEKAISIEYANDISGSAFAEPSDPTILANLKYCKSKRSLKDFTVAMEAGLERQGEEDKGPLTGEETQMNDQPRVSKGAASEVNADNGQGSACKLSNSAWNMRIVARLPGSLLRFMPDEVPGVTSPMVYIGMLFSWFAWHVEDHELHSLNYLHTGAPKTWYAVPGEAAPALEEAVRIHAYGGQLNSKDAFARLGEKTTVMSPEVLIAAGVPCCRLVQNAGEYVVTFPRAYHLGFSHELHMARIFDVQPPLGYETWDCVAGFNCGEAANLATPGWLHVAREAAARRAVMNYLPMLSHQQLLYMLALSLMSRSRSKKERLSQLTGKQKAAEAIVKSFFLSDVIHHNKLLGKLLSHGVTSCLLLKDPDVRVHHTPSSAEPSVLSTSLNIEDNIVIATETDHPVPLPPVSRPDFCDGDSLMGSLSNTSQQPVFDEHIHGLDSSAPSGECKHDEKKETWQPFKLTRYVSGIDCMTSLPPLDLGTMPCAACGMLCYSGMAVVQPSQTAAMVFRPLQTDVAGGNSLVGGSYLTGVLSAKADTTTPDFHILPSPEVAPLLESPNKLAETSFKDKQGEATRLTKDAECHVSSTNFVKKSTLGVEILNMCSTPLAADKCGILNGMVREDAGDLNLQGVDVVSEENQTMEVLKGQPWKTPLDENVLVPANVNGYTSRNLLPSDESGLGPITACERVDNNSQPAVTTIVSPFSGLDVSSKRASQGPPVCSGQEISSSARQQHIDNAMPRSKIGKLNGDKTISSLQLLATIYNGDSETDEADDKEENREDVAEEVSVVGIPHSGSGGRRLDCVGLSADAPWDSISRNVPGIDGAPIFATHWQDRGGQICRFTNHDVPSTSQAMAKIFSPGGLLVAGLLHERSHVPGEETQSPSRTTSAKRKIEASSSSIPSRGEMREDFDGGLEVVEKPSVDFESMCINRSNSSNAGLQNSGSLEASKAEKFKPEKDDNTSAPMASEIIAEHSTHMCCVERVKVDKNLELAPHLVRTSPSMGPHSIKIKLAGSSPCEPHLKLTGLGTQIVLKGYQENRLQRPLGECVTCSLPHDSFFDSFEEIANGSICKAQKDAAVCDGRESGLACTGGVQMQTCMKTATIPVVLDVTHNDLTTEGVLSFQVEANGHLPDTGSNIPVVISAGLEEVADRCSAQALECNISRHPSDNTNDRVSQESGGMHVRREAQSNTGMMYKGAAKPRVLCLEHAVTAQRLLEPLGGAHVVIVCHSRFPIMEQLAKETASEMGLHHDWKSIPMQIATDKERGIITAALEVEEGSSSGQSDWVGQLELSTYDVDKMCNEHLNIDPVSGRYLEGKGNRAGGKRRRLKEKILVGEWCGRGWYSEELHPLLGGCRFMSSMAKVIGSSSNASPPVNISNLSENGRPRRATRLTRLGDNGSENQLQFEVRKSGRMRRTVIDSAVNHSDEEDEDNKLIAIVCSNITQGRRTSQIGGPENRSQFLDYPPKTTPLWDQSNKHKEKDPTTHTLSPQSSGNSAPEVTTIQDSRNPTLTPLQWQQNRFSGVGSCVRPSESQHLTCVEDARMQPSSDDKKISQNPTSPVDELDNMEATNWLSNVPSPTTGDQGSHDEALETPTECQFPTKATVGESSYRLHSCPDGVLHSEPSNCCSVVGGFLQRDAKLQALQKLCRQRATTQSESYSLLTTPARMASCENITCSNITTSRLINRPKRRSFTESSAQSVKKPKHVEEGINKQDHVPRVSWEGENSSLSSILLFQEDQEEEVKRDRRVIIADARCDNEENGAGVGMVSCSVVECNQIFESDNLLETHWQACHTLPLKTLRLKSSAVSNLCAESSSHDPSSDPCQQFNRCSLPYEPAVVVPRRIVGARGRRTKGIGWKSSVHISSPGRQEEEDRLCQTWDENADEDLNREDCGSGVDADPDFSPYLSCLTSTSSRSRRRRARTPGMVEWGGVDDEGIETPNLGDLDPNEETDDDVKSKKRKKSRKTAAQKRFEEPEGEYQCDMDGCTMGFDTEQDLQLHKQNRCTWKGCGKHFHMHKYLLQHRRVHLDDRPLKCPWKGCPQAFKWAWARTEHIRVHTGERPYKCTVSGCGQTFRFVSDFSRHKRNTGHRPS